VADDSTASQKSLFGLIASLPRLLIALAKEEIEQLKRELIAKLTRVGIGVGLFAAAAVSAVFMVGVFLAAAVLGLATVVPAWLAALIVGGILLLVSLTLVLVGLTQLKRGMPSASSETLTSVKKDLNAIKAIGKQDKP